MTIEFSCDCGKEIRVAEKFAGRHAKCPGCGQPIVIPQPQTPTDEFDGDLLYEAIGGSPDAAQEVKCPNCDHAMDSNAVICTHCGFNRVARTHVQLADAGKEPKKRREGKPILSLAGMEMGIIKVVVLLGIIVGIPWWYYNYPGASMHINDMHVVNIVPALTTGEVAEAFSTGGSGMMQMIKAVNKDNKPPTLDKADEAMYALGSSDELIISTPDDAGDHVVMRVALRQQTIKDKGSTSLYDTIIKGEDFKLEPVAGGPSVDGARILYNDFEQGRLQLDLAGSDTSSYRAMFPSEPTQVDIDRGGGVIRGKAMWYQPTAKGELNFTTYYATGDMPPPRGLSGEGRLEVFNQHGSTVDLNYEGSQLDVSWDHDATGWWARKRYDEPSHDWPWFRYEFGLMFQRPQEAGHYRVTYRGRKVGKIWLEQMEAPKPPPVSPIKRALAQSQGGQTGGGSNNPLEYFTLLAQARKQAQGIVSASNLRQIGIGLQLYLEQHKGQWPDRIDQLSTIIDGFDQVMVNPRTNARPGFIYVKPEKGADPATTAVVYESWQGQPDPDGAVLYADGHIE